MNCNWCGDEVAEGVWEAHKCKESEIITCFNCGYEVSEVDKNTTLCQTCKKAYDIGWQLGWQDRAEGAL